MAELGGGVNEEIEGRELGATAGEARRPLADGDIDVGEAGLAEDDTLYVLGSGLGLREGDSHGPMVTRSGQKGVFSPTLAKPKPVIVVHLTPRALRYASASLRILGQEDVMGWSCTGRVSRMRGCASGPPMRLGQGWPVL